MMKSKFFIPVIVLVISVACITKNNKKEQKRSPIPGSVNISDSALLDIVEKQTFQYFYDGAEPVSGMGRERIHEDNDYPDNDKMIVTSGGSGFGVMAILAAIHRNFISRAQGRVQLEKIVHFLQTADRFHGAWPHWLNGETGKVKPFGRKDNGGDLVETSYMIQGLLCARQFFKDGDSKEKELANMIDKLWKEVEYDWYRNGKNVLYWHWSPDYNWEMNFPVHGYNECLILYVLAASSPTHGVPAEVYHEGWAENGSIKGMNRMPGIHCISGTRVTRHTGDLYSGRNIPISALIQED